MFQRLIDELKNTGERPILNTLYEDTHSVLQFAYDFASKRIKNENMTVLDYGCGGGYGTEYLSRFTLGLVTGYDIDSATIINNQSFFTAKKNLIYTSNAAELTKYDLVVSFQVIEHLPEDEIRDYLEKIKSCVKPGGLALLATVNKNISSFKMKKPAMPFHIHEFYPQELADLLKEFFPAVTVYGQIEKNLSKKVEQGSWSYRDISKITWRTKVIRVISQWESVRFIARYVPLFLKGLIFGYNNKIDRQVYQLSMSQDQLDNSYILLYECRG